MDILYKNVKKSIDHLKVLHGVFNDKKNYPGESSDYVLYKENFNALKKTIKELKLDNQIYSEKARQMILADIIEYIFLGRGFYAIGANKQNGREAFIKSILYFVNMLMSYDSITVDEKKRRNYLRKLSLKIPEIKREEHFNKLLQYSGSIGLTSDPDNIKYLSKYFDKLLPKTAGGLWHELLVYAYMLRLDMGYILPLLLHQRIFSLNDHLVPPDFLLLTFDKRIYGIEVGRKKEIQSGAFSIKTALPTASIDTINSRNSDRCPSCQKWIQICPYVIDTFTDSTHNLGTVKINCIETCTKFKPEEIVEGLCKYSKYKRSKAKSLKHSQHKFADNKHYHYKCVLNGVSPSMRKRIIDAKDKTAIVTHYPNYAGLENLNTKQNFPIILNTNTDIDQENETE